MLAIEILAQALRKDDVLKGLQFDNFEVRQILYADDMTLFVRNESSITRIQEIFRDFFELSGFKVILKKNKCNEDREEKRGVRKVTHGKYSYRNKDFRSVLFIEYKN